MAFSANIFGPNTGKSIASRRTSAADAVADQGRRGDTAIIHASPFTRTLLKAMGGAGIMNPKTGLMEFAPLNLGGIGGVDVGPSTSESDAISGLTDAGYVVTADEAPDFFAGLDDNLDDDVDVGAFVQNLYGAAGRTDTIDKEGANYWADEYKAAVSGESGKSTLDVVKSFVNAASVIDEQRDALNDTLAAGTYNDYFATFGDDAASSVQSLVDAALPEYGTVEQLAGKYYDSYQAASQDENITDYTFEDLRDYAVNTLGDQSIIDQDKIGFLPDLTGMTSNELGTLYNADDYTIDQKSYNDSKVVLDQTVRSLAAQDERLGAAISDTMSNLSAGEALLLVDQVAKGSDPEKLVLSTLVGDGYNDNNQIGFSEVAAGEADAGEVFADAQDASFDDYLGILEATGQINAITPQQEDQIIESYKSATGKEPDDDMTAKDILAELSDMFNSSSYNPLAFLNAFGFAMDPTLLGTIVPTMSNGVAGAYTLRRVKDKETGEYRTIRVPIDPNAINNTARSQRRAGFGSVISV
jgi:hypothetical protein